MEYVYTILADEWASEEWCQNLLLDWKHMQPSINLK